ncbi:MAG: L-rhamnose isomerase [Clostridia bacterium]|jgi:L-rhamnose isomerase|nr:L-rhamnose isomerase [Clostridia bacterium]MBT7121373.1 L-rhamnose isomerase [Clostridia bacterium]
MRSNNEIKKDYEIAKSRYAGLGVNTDKAIENLKKVSLSVHCWQGDDVTGLEGGGALTGGIMATGKYMGKARDGDELRADIDKAFSLIPGSKKLNLHASYAEFEGEPVDRDKIGPQHFAKWIDWAKKNGIGMDFNPTLFSHDMFRDNMTITHPDDTIRQFWIEHCKRTREIGAEIGRQLGQPCVNNIWAADGMKDTPADRMGARQRLKDSLDEIFERKFDKNHLVDAVESKLFGIGSESFVPGSFEFYLGYAVKNNLTLCLDSGHYHPTETISDKISSALLYIDTVLLHVSRGVRWDSDHVATLSDDTKQIARECVASGMDRIFYALDFFDASINRIAAWVIGSRAFLKAMMIALLEMPAIKQAEENFDYTTRFALTEEEKQLPWGAVWDEYCAQCGVPVGFDWLGEVRKYEDEVLSKR